MAAAAQLMDRPVGAVRRRQAPFLHQQQPHSQKSQQHQQSTSRLLIQKEQVFLRVLCARGSGADRLLQAVRGIEARRHAITTRGLRSSTRVAVS